LINHRQYSAKIEAGECQVMCAPKFMKDSEKYVELSFKIANDISEACLFDRGRIQQITANMIGGIGSSCIQISSGS
jgi:hypothetical protein